MGQTLIIHFIDRDIKSRAEAARLVLGLGYHAEVYSCIAEIVQHPPQEGIIVVRDDALPGGVTEIVDALCTAGLWLPLVIASESTAVSRVVEAISAGAIDYLPLPLEEAQVAALLKRVGQRAAGNALARRGMIEARARIASLSDREREVLDLLVRGGSNKLIARELEISPRTVEIHRANMMEKLGARHVADAVRLSIEARLDGSAAGD